MQEYASRLEGFKANAGWTIHRLRIKTIEPQCVRWIQCAYGILAFEVYLLVENLAVLNPASLF